MDMKKDDGFAALHLAALNGHFDVTQTLMVTASFLCLHCVLSSTLVLVVFIMFHVHL